MIGSPKDGKNGMLTTPQRYVGNGYITIYVLNRLMLFQPSSSFSCDSSNSVLVNDLMDRKDMHFIFPIGGAWKTKNQIYFSCKTLAKCSSFFNFVL